MKNQREISTIRLMMIVSQLLLALFLGYWLYSQFAYNKKILVEDLERGLRKSEKQVIDSLLATNLIDPYLNDSSNFSMILIDGSVVDSSIFGDKFNSGHDSIIRFIKHISSNDEEIARLPDYQFKKREISISITDSIPSHSTESITVQARNDTANQLLFQSARLFISTVGVFANSEDSLSSFLYSNIDTTLLKELFENYINKKEFGVSVSWLKPDDSFLNKKLSSNIFLKSTFIKDFYGTSINKYQIYLFRSIGPEFIFALLLLLITSIAFRMAYISLKSQRKLMVIKNDFISNISHELKTPVSTVKVALEALLDFDMKKDPKLTEEYLKMAHREMNRLDVLVNKVLKNSALENGGKFIFPEKINLNKLVDDVLHSMKSRFRQTGAKIEIVADDDDVYVYADSLHIHGVIGNLIDNSLKYNEGVPEITITINKSEKETSLSISDNGIGIKLEYIDKIFDKFFRVPNKDRHNVKGYGLGLNYVALVMEHHKGKISVKNLAQGGCVFTISFTNSDIEK